MATAVQNLWPEAKFGVGPAIDNGFYYDIDLGDQTISDDDFGKIEAEMKKVIEANQPFEQFDLPIDEAIKWAQETNQPYKAELLNDLKREGTTSAKDLDGAQLGVASDDSKVENVSFYRNGSFTDLCRGPHVANTGDVGAFKLYKIAGAYWRGDETKPQMQRLYGAGFETQEQLDNFFKQLEEAKARDHRKLGKELDLFTFSDLVGSGLPLFTPRGTILRELLLAYSNKLRTDCGFKAVTSPHITKKSLYEKSGHWEKFGDELFLVESQETDDEMVLKPMSCPHHAQIYASQPRSYRDLPVMYMENAVVYRDEKTGELHGLSRVRSITQDDSHAFVREDQIEEVVTRVIEAAQEMYGTLQMSLKFDLSFRSNEDKYLGDPELWESAQNSLRELAKKNQLDFTEVEGEAAFYGPKIDFIAVDSLGREWQLATVQLDFVQPDRFGLTYTAEDGTAKQPVMIHVALLGSIERFLSVYIEHVAGRFPIWLAPEQIRVATVNSDESVVNFATSLVEQGRELGLRLELDTSNESVGKKIRASEVAKVPYTLVIGAKEVEAGKVQPRIRSDIKVDGNEEAIEVDHFLKTVANEARGKVNKTSVHAYDEHQQ